MLTQKQIVDQQFWLFGRDVVSEDGNRLVQLGGERIAEWRRGKAAVYRMPLFGDARSRIVLWGFGALHVVDDLATAYLQRSTGLIRVPNRSQASICCEHAKAESFLAWRPIKRDAQSWLSPIAQWIARHERSVRKRYGLGARRSDVEQWARLGKPTTAPETIPLIWDRIAGDALPESMRNGTPSPASQLAPKSLALA